MRHKRGHHVIMSRSDALDLDRIDTALLSLLEPRLHSMFKYAGGLPKWLTWTGGSDEPDPDSAPFAQYESLSLTILRGCLYWFTLIGHIRPLPSPNKNDFNKSWALVEGIQTPAMRAMGLTLSDSNHLESSTKPSLDKWQVKQRKIKYYIFLSIVGPALQQILCFLHTHFYSTTTSMPSTNPLESNRRTTTLRSYQLIAYQRQRKIISWIVNLFGMTLPWAHISALLLFLHRNGGPTTPALYLSGLQYHDTTNNYSNNHIRNGHRFNPFYAHRRTLLDQIQRVLPTFTQLWTSTSSHDPRSPTLHFNALWDNPIHQLCCRIVRQIRLRTDKIPRQGSTSTSPLPTVCCICHSIPCIPYEALPCLHVYCYTCLRQSIVDTFSFRCTLCGSLVETSRRM
jgi:hypothetical protein